MYATSHQLPLSREKHESGVHAAGSPPIYKEQPHPAEAYRRALLMTPGVLALHLLWSGNSITSGALAMSGLVSYLLRNAVTDQQAPLLTGLGVGVFVCGANANTTTRLMGGTAGMLAFSAPNLLL